MTKDIWLNYRERVVHGDLEATMKAFSFYCETNGLNPNPREIQIIQRLISLKALINWVDVQLKVNIITSKEGLVVKVL